MPISEHQHEQARAVYNRLRDAGIRAELDDRNEKIGYKIRAAQLQKVPFMLIIGEKEAESGNVSVRARQDGDLGVMPFADFLALIRGIIDRKEKK